jgi:hypothetical protein
MVHRQIDLDEETDRILSRLAEDYQGDAGKAIAELLRLHRGVESFAEESELAHRDSLIAQRERAERGFREGLFTAWDQVRRRHDL